MAGLKRYHLGPRDAQGRAALIVSSIKHLYLKYRVDTATGAAGCIVLRLPPCHCELSPIELLWAQIKNHVASINTTQKIGYAGGLLKEAILSISPSNWKKAVEPY